LAAEVKLVGLNGSNELGSILVDHAKTQFLEPPPAGFVAAKAQAVKGCCAHLFFFTL
jgi:hypothetical protein